MSQPAWCCRLRRAFGSQQRLLEAAQATDLLAAHNIVLPDSHQSRNNLAVVVEELWHLNCYVAGWADRSHSRFAVADPVEPTDWRFYHTKPQSVYNTVRPGDWPVWPGSHVMYFSKAGSLRAGWVSHYNPAREIDASFVTTPGEPCVTAVSGEHSEIVPASQVTPVSMVGLQRLAARRVNGIKGMRKQLAVAHLEAMEQMEASERFFAELAATGKFVNES